MSKKLAFAETTTSWDIKVEGKQRKHVSIDRDSNHSRRSRGRSGSDDDFI